MLTVRTHHVLQEKFQMNNVGYDIPLKTPNKFFNSRNGVNKLLYNRTHKVLKQMVYTRDDSVFCYDFQCLAHSIDPIRTVVRRICVILYQANDTEKEK